MQNGLATLIHPKTSCPSLYSPGLLFSIPYQAHRAAQGIYVT